MESKTGEPSPKDPAKTYGLMALVKGTSKAVEKGPEDTLMAWPHLLILEVLTFLGLMVLLLIWSLLVNAPLREIANPDLSENPAKAPWYFMNLQELLLHMHPALAGVLIPLAVILALMAIPYIDRSKADVGIWFASKRGRRIALFSAVYATILISLLVLFDELVRVRSLVEVELLVGWVIPLGIMGALMAILYLLIRLWRPTMREALIGLFSAFAASYILLTVVGTFFRGLGMHLVWPWDLPPGALPF